MSSGRPPVWESATSLRVFRTAQTPGELVAPALDPALLRRVEDRLAAADIPVAEIGLRLPSLDDVFLALTGHTAEEAA